MEVNKFDKSLKQKLESRHIVPSPDAWQKLEQQLEKHDKSNRFKPFWGLGIAASMVGVILAISVFLKDGTQVEQHIIVDLPIKENTDADSPIKTSSPELVETEIAKILNDDAKDASNNKSVEKGKSSNTTYALTNTKSKTEQSETNTAKTVNLEKNQVLVAENETAKDVESPSSVDDEVDLLLQQAKNQLNNEAKISDSRLAIDADQLLESVDDYREQSFRQRAMEALLVSFKTVKTAVVQRND